MGRFRFPFILWADLRWSEGHAMFMPVAPWVVAKKIYDRVYSSVLWPDPRAYELRRVTCKNVGYEVSLILRRGCSIVHAESMHSERSMEKSS